MKYYKLLTQDLTSYEDTKWEIGTPITIAKEGVEMCSDQVLHCYNHPVLAVVFNPIHASIYNPKLFEIEVDKIVATDGLKFASKSQTLIREISLPEITTKQKIEFAIKVAKLVYKGKSWNSWANDWLSREDCSKNSDDATHADAAAADASAAAYTARAAAADAAYAAYAADAADAAAYTAYAASAAAYAGATGADAAADTKNEFNQKMIKIIESILDKQKS
jgi:hypothetical protein